MSFFLLKKVPFKWGISISNGSVAYEQVYKKNFNKKAKHAKHAKQHVHKFFKYIDQGHFKSV